MSIWAEIKKAINSNLSLPLNEKIDRDIEENRIGHGFSTSTEPSSKGSGMSNNYKEYYKMSSDYLSSSYGFSHILYLDGFYYLFGHRNSAEYWFKVTEDFSTITRMSPDIPYSFYYASAVVYRGEIYLIGSGSSSYAKNFYKFNGESWVKLTNLSFYNQNRFSPIVHEDKVYLWDNSNKVMRCYDGTNWSTVPLAYTLSQKSDINGQLFYFKDKLHLAVWGNDGTNSITDIFCLENNTFVDSPYVPNYYYAGGNIHYIMHFLPTPSGRLYAYGASYAPGTYELVKGSWSKLSSALYPIDDSFFSFAFSFANDKVIQLSDSAPELYVTDLNFYKQYIFHLPKNTRVFFGEGEPNRFAAISNCRVLEDGSILTFEDGEIEFRSFGDLNPDTPVLFR